MASVKFNLNPHINNYFNYMMARESCVPVLKGREQLEKETYCIIINEGSYTNGKSYRQI